MQSLGQSALKFAQKVPVAKPDKVRAANFARMKEDWQKWLGRDTLLAWPSQSTLADLLHTSPRQIQTSMRALEERGHLKCESKFRGGRKSNRYRIILDGPMVMEESRTLVPVTPEPGFRAKENAPSPVRGADVPGCGDVAFRGTAERTPEKTSMSGCRKETGVPVTADMAKGIMAQVFGEGRVNASG
jgi:hypothetical protein